MTYEAVEKVYETKCKKYKPEQLTQSMREVLYMESIEEVSYMEYMNKRCIR